jgi:hypothetical protein
LAAGKQGGRRVGAAAGEVEILEPWEKISPSRATEPRPLPAKTAGVSPASPPEKRQGSLCVGALQPTATAPVQAAGWRQCRLPGGSGVSSRVAAV